MNVIVLACVDSHIIDIDCRLAAGPPPHERHQNASHTPLQPHARDCRDATPSLSTPPSYSGTCSPPLDNLQLAFDLLACASRLLLPGLQLLCERRLSSRVTAEVRHPPLFVGEPLLFGL